MEEGGGRRRASLLWKLPVSDSRMLGLQAFTWVLGIRTLFFTTKVVLAIALRDQRGLIFFPLDLLPLITL